ncbi:MAG TPA: response regulator transcription factor [Burkholderiaceae bacterium]
MIRVAICDDHEIVRQGFKKIMEQVSDMEVSAEAETCREALEIARKEQCDVLLLDINMPEQSGIDVLRTIKQGQPGFHVLMLSGFPAEQYAVNALRIGADGYLDKNCEPSEMEHAIRLVARGRRYLNPAVGDMLARNFCQADAAPAHTKLSDREFQVFLRLCKGEAVSDMAEKLCLSVKTISTYRARVLEKMRAHSNAELTYYAMKNGLLE